MASGDTLLIFLPQGNEPPATNFATFDTRNNHPVLDFDDTTSESAIWSAILPRNYAGGGLTVYIYFSAIATSGDVDWDVSFERIGDRQQDVDVDGFAAVNSVINQTVPGTPGFVDRVNVTFTDGADMDGILVGEQFRIKIARNVADTAVGDLELHAISIKET